MAKEKTRYEYEALKSIMTQNYVTDFINLACNSVVIDGLPDEIPEDYIIETLIRNGVIMEYRGDVYKPAYKGQQNRHGRSINAALLTGNGRTAYPNVRIDYEGNDPEGAHQIRANVSRSGYLQYITQIAETLAALDMSLRVNVSNSQTPWFLPVENKEQVASVRRAYEDMTIGLPVIPVLGTVADSIKAQPTPTDFIGDKIESLRKTIWDGALKRIGIVTDNNFKRERVQTAEVNASIGESIDYIYTLIDTFNKDTAKARLPWVMRFNGYVAKYDTDEPEETPTEENKNDEENEDTENE